MNEQSWFKRAVSRIRTRLHRALWGSDIHPTVFIDASAYIDRTWPKGIHIAERCRIGPDAIVLAHDMTRGLYLDTRLGAGTLLERRSIVMPGVTVGPGCEVAEAAVVTRDVPAYHRAEGNPAVAIPLSSKHAPTS